MMTSLTRALLALAATTALLPNDAAAQPSAAPPAGRAMSTRAELEAITRQLSGSTKSEDAQRLAEIRTRLTEGDFRSGDRIRLEVPGEPALTDTFTVTGDLALKLPPPTTEPLSLKGVLRSELEPRATEFVAKFLVQPTAVRAQPLLRLSVQGEVHRSGVIDVPADAQLGEVLRAAGGTTNLANLKKLSIQRDGKPIWQGQMLDRALADGRSLSDADLQSGDQVLVPRKRDVGVEGNLRFLWVIVSLAGGVYGLSRAF